MHRLEQHIESNWSHLKSNLISVACSGGLDSIVLAFVLKKLHFNVNVIHVNYQLRGEDSEKDAKFVERFCIEQNLAFDKRVVDLNESLQNGGNLQELARNYRYEWFREIIEENSENKIALAHHLNDQVETFFLNLGRKSGVMGLACMPAENNGIIRPLLEFTKDELKSYAEENAIAWREDVSNANSKYKRNLLRNVILPELEMKIPTLNDSVITLIRQFQTKQKELEEEVSSSGGRLDLNPFILLSDLDALSELAYLEYFRQLGQPVGIAMEIKKLKHKGTKVELIPSEKHDFTTAVFDGDRISFLTANGIEIPELNVELTYELPTTFSKNIIYLDKSKIKGQLHIRKWQIGDRIASIGIEGTQLISDIISDAKLNAHEKAKVFVVCDDQNIHWCVGLKVGRLALADHQDGVEILKCWV